MLTNQYTHDFPKDIGAQLAHVVTTKPIPITERGIDIPLGLAVAIHWGLNHDPHGRHSDALAFRQELIEFM